MKKEALQEIKCRVDDIAKEGRDYSLLIIGRSGSKYRCHMIPNIDDVLYGTSNCLIVQNKGLYEMNNTYIDLDSIESITAQVRI